MTMRTVTIDITLEQPAVFSLQSGSAGAHRGLDYIPGSTLLGHAAGTLYTQLSTDDAWTLFHSGRVRFGDGLPVCAAATAWPVPLSWHAIKGDAPLRDGRFLDDALFDPSFVTAQQDSQPRQVRGGYVTESGDFVLPPRVQTLKTTIDPATGRAAEGQLFGYEAIAAGQRFRAVLSRDADVHDDLWKRLTEVMQGSARLGRSRSAQFGRVVMQAEELGEDTPRSTPPSEELTLWLLSDLALDRAGQPCLAPEPSLLGLPAGSEWLADSSFLRPRRYSPYNAYRRHYDTERQLISRGSVLRYRLSTPLDSATVRMLESGVGQHIEAGLGRVAVNPRLLSTSPPQFAAHAVASPSRETRKAPASSPLSPFARALAARHARLHGDGMEAAARDLHRRYGAIVKQARAYDAFSEPPGRSQWGRLKQLASDHRHESADLLHALFNQENGAIRARAKTGWEVRYGTDPGERLADWMQAALQDAQGDLSELIGQLATVVLHEQTPDQVTGEPA
jgi:CRISPR-associated protein Csx10